MLRPPHIRYEHLFVYYFDKRELKPFQDPDLIGTWMEDDNAILFFHRAKDELVEELCRTSGATVIYQAELSYRDWEAGTDIGSFVTRFLRVRPVWEEASAQELDNREEIILDPSVIFGSGFHATTRLCLETLEFIFGDAGRSPSSVVDLGAGTGLLSIAAAKLGALSVVAVDNNPLACEVARRNVAFNDCSDRVEVVQADLKGELPELSGCDLVVANLYKGLLQGLFANPCFWQAKQYLLSGFIAGMEGDLLAALPSGGVTFLHRGISDIWRLWVLHNRGIKQ